MDAHVCRQVARLREGLAASGARVGAVCLYGQITLKFTTRQRAVLCCGVRWWKFCPFRARLTKGHRRMEEERNWVRVLRSPTSSPKAGHLWYRRLRLVSTPSRSGHAAPARARVSACGRCCLSNRRSRDTRIPQTPGILSPASLAPSSHRCQPVPAAAPRSFLLACHRPGLSASGAPLAFAMRACGGARCCAAAKSSPGRFLNRPPCEHRTRSRIWGFLTSLVFIALQEEHVGPLPEAVGQSSPAQKPHQQQQ